MRFRQRRWVYRAGPWFGTASHPEVGTRSLLNRESYQAPLSRSLTDTHLMNPPRQTLGSPHRTSRTSQDGVLCQRSSRQPFALRGAAGRRGNIRKIKKPHPMHGLWLACCGDGAGEPLRNTPGSWFGRGTLQIVSAWMTLQRQGSWVAVLPRRRQQPTSTGPEAWCRALAGGAVAPVCSAQCHSSDDQDSRLWTDQTDQTGPVLRVFCGSARWAKIACIFLDCSRVDGFVFELSGHPVPITPAIGARACTAASHSDFWPRRLAAGRCGGQEQQGPGASGETRANKRRRPTELTRRAD